MDPLFELNDKLILVSGGSRGIGKALVSGFAKRGARVVFTGRDEVSLESAKKELAEIHPGPSSIPGGTDLADGVLHKQEPWLRPAPSLMPPPHWERPPWLSDGSINPVS